MVTNIKCEKYVKIECSEQLNIRCKKELISSVQNM